MIGKSTTTLTTLLVAIIGLQCRSNFNIQPSTALMRKSDTAHDGTHTRIQIYLGVLSIAYAKGKTLKFT